MKDSSSPRVNWGLETLRVLGIMGHVLFRVFSWFMNILLTLLLIGLICGIIVSTVFAIYINNHLDLEIDPTSIVTVNRDSATRIYYMKYDTMEDRVNRNGTPVEIEDQRLTGDDSTIAVSFSQIPENLYHAFIAIEDKRFEEHNGVDWITTAQSVFKFVFGGNGGGSTITQQLIKNVTGEDSYTIQRKVEEIFRALNLEKVKSKEEIFEAYCNIVYLGNNCDGVQAAANFYFGKDVSQLDLVECAAIAAIVQNPSQFEPKYHDKDRVKMDADGNPVLNEDGEPVYIRGNEYRRWVVLDQMCKQGYITEAECVKAQNTELVVVSHDEEEDEVSSEGMTIYDWYTEAVISQLIVDLAEKYNVTQRAASQMIFNSGYKIYVPMDPYVQNTLEEIYENDREYFPSTGSGLQPQSAMVICDPYTGDVLGTVGGRGKKIINRGTDRATVATRPPGSSIKPLSVYGPALDAGVITYATAVDDTPLYFYPYLIQEATEWSEAQYGYYGYPKNLPEIYYGLTPIHDAIRRSVNTVAMKVLNMYGVEKSFNFMKNELNFHSLIEGYTNSSGQYFTDIGEAALALGQPNYGVTVLEMAAGYCMFQNNGMYNEPNLYLYVEDGEGKVVFDYSDDPRIVISEESASIMTIMLQEVMTGGTGMACTLQQQVNVAGKTGTTSQDFDRYFVGYTPYYVGAVWTGYDIPQSLSAFGENPSLQVWDLVMTRLHQKYIDEANAGGEPLRKFEVAPGVITATYCRDSGQLVNDACSLDPRMYRAEVGYFTRESVPKTKCSTHVRVLRDTMTGGIAYPTTTCPSWNCSWTSLIRVENRSFPTEVYIVDAQYVYREMPSWATPAYWAGVAFFRNLLKDGEFCGSSYAVRPYNSYCVEHGVWNGWQPQTQTWDSGGSSNTSGGGTSDTGQTSSGGGSAEPDVVIDDGSADDGFEDWFGND